MRISLHSCAVDSEEEGGEWESEAGLAACQPAGDLVRKEKSWREDSRVRERGRASKKRMKEEERRRREAGSPCSSWELQVAGAQVQD
eukprot:3674894-Rhodomonas_salina.1